MSHGDDAIRAENYGQLLMQVVLLKRLVGMPVPPPPPSSMPSVSTPAASIVDPLYSVIVRKPGFVTYQSKVKVGPGEEPAILATLPEETTPVTKKVWFWSVAAVVVAGAAVGTYFLTRPDPERPAPNGGALGWVVTVPAGR